MEDTETVKRPFGPGDPPGKRVRSLKGLARQIRERTADLTEQIAVMIRISLDDTHKMQVDAIKWLAERAYGRVPEIAAFAELDEAEARTAIKALSSEQLEALIANLAAVHRAELAHQATSKSV